LLQTGADLRELEGLGDVVQRAQLEAPHRDVHLRDPAHHHDGDLGPALLNGLEQRDPIHPRHVEVG
jgi:hypothetical protein